ncbi:hypothetical protein V8E36_003183 [Tilletia maclaganii]
MHKIYFVDLSDGAQTVLRVSRKSAAEDRTEVEVATLAYVHRHTPIPVPAPRVLFWSANPVKSELGRPYTVMTRLEGTPLSDILSLSPSSHEQGAEAMKMLLPSTADLRHIANQVCQVQLALSAVRLPPSGDGPPSPYIGALQFGRNPDGTLDESRFEIGPYFDEFMIEEGALKRHWAGTGASLASLNIAGPYPTWTHATAAWIKTYIYMIKTHSALIDSRHLIARLEKLVSQLEQEHIVAAFQRDHLDAVELAHNDLHAGNLLVQRRLMPEGESDGQQQGGGRRAEWVLTGVLDWEIATTYPSFLNPRRNFLHPMLAPATATSRPASLVAQCGKDRHGAIFSPEAYQVYLELGANPDADGDAVSSAPAPSWSSARQQPGTSPRSPPLLLRVARKHALLHGRFSPRFQPGPPLAPATTTTTSADGEDAAAAAQRERRSGDESTPLQILSMMRNYLRAITEVCVQEAGDEGKVELARGRWTEAVVERLDLLEEIIAGFEGPKEDGSP